MLKTRHAGYFLFYNTGAFKVPKDLLSLLHFSKEEILGFISKAEELKTGLKAGTNHFPLKGKVVVLIFEKPSLRTHVTFETGIVQLGGHPVYLTQQNIDVGKRETPQDVARNLERWVNGIVARTFSQEMIEEMAANASIPVINALSDDYHPCQALATGLTIKEHFRRLDDLKIAFIGDGNNVAKSLFIMCAKLGIHSTLVCPRGYEIDRSTMKTILSEAEKSKVEIKTEHNPEEGVRDADLIYTDVWASMGQEDQAAKRKKEFMPFQVNQELISHAKAGCKISHCLPAHRGEEATSEVLDSEYCVMFDEAENRLHVQKAVMSLLIK
jgi:ornithine carbamoyltransferase